MPIITLNKPENLRVRILKGSRLVRDDGIDGCQILKRISLSRPDALRFRKGLKVLKENSLTPWGEPYRSTPELQFVFEVLRQIFTRPNRCWHSHDCCGCSSQDWYEIHPTPKTREFFVLVVTTYNV